MSSSGAVPKIETMVSLKVDNLSYRTTRDDLRAAFERCGEVGDIYIPRDRNSRESRGFAFVRFLDKRDAEEALKEMHGRNLDGRELRVQMARYGRPSSPSNRGGGGGGAGRYNDRGGDRYNDRGGGDRYGGGNRYGDRGGSRYGGGGDRYGGGGDRYGGGGGGDRYGGGGDRYGGGGGGRGYRGGDRGGFRGGDSYGDRRRSRSPVRRRSRSRSADSRSPVKRNNKDSRSPPPRASPKRSTSRNGFGAVRNGSGSRSRS